MKSAAFFIIISLLGASGTIQAQCLKKIPIPNEELLQTNSKNPLRINQDLKLLQKALAKLDCQVNFVTMPFARSIVELENGRVDILDGAYKKLGRKRPSFKTDPTAWRSFLYYPARLVGFERIS